MNFRMIPIPSHSHHSQSLRSESHQGDGFRKFRTKDWGESLGICLLTAVAYIYMFFHIKMHWYCSSREASRFHHLRKRNEGLEKPPMVILPTWGLCLFTVGQNQRLMDRFWQFWISKHQNPVVPKDVTRPNLLVVWYQVSAGSTRCCFNDPFLAGEVNTHCPFRWLSSSELEALNQPHTCLRNSWKLPKKVLKHAFNHQNTGWFSWLEQRLRVSCRNSRSGCSQIWWSARLWPMPAKEPSCGRPTWRSVGLSAEVSIKDIKDHPVKNLCTRWCPLQSGHPNDS